MMIQIDCKYRVSQKLNQIDQKIEENHVGLNLTMDVT